MDITQVLPKTKVASGAPLREYTENDQVFPAGMWRTIVTGDAYEIQRATAADWSAVLVTLSIASDGSFTGLASWTLPDDIPIQLGTGGTAKILWETADANANELVIALPNGGATDVPVIVIGDQSVLNVDLGWFNGVVEPTLAIANAAGDAYISIDAGDDAVAAAKGIYFKAAADEDIEIINLSVTGTPRIFWDESEDAFSITKGITFGADALVIASGNTDAQYGLIKSRDSGVGLVETARFVGAADPYIQIGRDDTGVAINAITDGLVLQMGAGANNEAAGQGFGINIKLGNAASEVEERAYIDFLLTDATNGSEDVQINIGYMVNGINSPGASFLNYDGNRALAIDHLVSLNQAAADFSIYARRSDATPAFRFYTLSDAAADTVRLMVTGTVAIAVATWTAITHTGIQLTGAASAFGGVILPTGAGKTVDEVITALQNLGLVTQA